MGIIPEPPQPPAPSPEPGPTPSETVTPTEAPAPTEPAQNSPFDYKKDDNSSYKDFVPGTNPAFDDLVRNKFDNSPIPNPANQPPIAPTVEPQEVASSAPEPSPAPAEAGFPQILNQVRVKEPIQQPGVIVIPIEDAEPTLPPEPKILSAMDAAEKYGSDPRPKPTAGRFSWQTPTPIETTAPVQPAAETPAPVPNKGDLQRTPPFTTGFYAPQGTPAPTPTATESLTDINPNWTAPVEPEVHDAMADAKAKGTYVPGPDDTQPIDMESIKRLIERQAQQTTPLPAQAPAEQQAQSPVEPAPAVNQPPYIDAMGNSISPAELGELDGKEPFSAFQNPQPTAQPQTGWRKLLFWRH